MTKITWTNERRNGHGVSVELTCQYCGKMFWLKRCSAIRGHGKYCSKECQFNAGSIIKHCEVCNKEFRFKISHHKMGQGRYCSIACRTIGYDRRGILKGEKAPRYIDGKSQTPEYVCMKSQERRAKKIGNGGCYTPREWIDLCSSYGNRCLACGRDDIKLTVDHVIPVKIGGTNNIDNLQPLCKSCNSKKNTKVIDYR